MIGYQLLAAELPNGNLLCGKVGFFSLELAMGRETNGWDEVWNAKTLYEETLKREDNEFEVSKEELSKIIAATHCIGPKDGIWKYPAEKYHKYACDGVTVIPVTMDKFISAKEYLYQQRNTYPNDICSR